MDTSKIFIKRQLLQSVCEWEPYNEINSGIKPIVFELIKPMNNLSYNKAIICSTNMGMFFSFMIDVQSKEEATKRYSNETYGRKTAEILSVTSNGKFIEGDVNKYELFESAIGIFSKDIDLNIISFGTSEDKNVLQIYKER